MDDVIFNVDLGFFLSPLKVQLLNDLLLLFKRNISVKNLAIESFYFRLHISQLVLRNLQISLGPKTHFGDLSEGSQVLLLNFEDLRASILFNLLHCLIVVPLHSLNVLAQMSDLLVFFGHSILVVLLLLVDLLSVILIDGSLSVAEFSRFLLLLLL